MFSIPATNASTRAIPRLVALAMLIGALALTLMAIGLISVVAACLVAPMVTVCAVMAGIAAGVIPRDYG